MKVEAEKHPIRVLLVEDNPADVDLIRELLSCGDLKGQYLDDVPRGEPISEPTVDSSPTDHPLASSHLEQAGETPQLVSASSLSEALKAIERRRPDAILLDLGLPDSQGVDTFCRLHRRAPDVPVVVITGLDDDAVGIEALNSGAQDYLIKGRTGPELLSRSIRYAIQRQHLQHQLDLERRLREADRDKLALHGLTAPASVASRLYGRKPLHEASREVFTKLSTEYGRLLRMALERQVTKIERDVSSDLRELADSLGALAAGPRDVVEVHNAALTAAAEDETASKIQALTQEGRFLVLELMGHLVSYYRRNFTNPRASTRKAAMTPRAQAPGPQDPKGDV